MYNDKILWYANNYNLNMKLDKCENELPKKKKRNDQYKTKLLIISLSKIFRLMWNTRTKL